jgi:hypothetical protein
LVEQRIENPRVGGSNPPPGTIFGKNVELLQVFAAAVRVIAHTIAHTFALPGQLLPLAHHRPRAIRPDAGEPGGAAAPAHHGRADRRCLRALKAPTRQITCTLIENGGELLPAM